jgi:pyridoxal phosphate enzyme (YggS family)
MDLEIKARLERLEEKIEAACRRSGRKRNEIKLMGVTKFQSAETVEAAMKAGLKLFGESRVLEGIEKFTEIRSIHADAELHLIGSLQRNKAKKAAAFFDCIQSVDREPLIDELGALTSNRECPLMIMLEYHTGEETKAGFPDLESLIRAAEKVLSYPRLYPGGLMTMAPFTSDEKTLRLSFRKMVSAREALKKRFGGDDYYWSCLSMGMTNDFEIAIEEGSNLIRIGTAIFKDID